MTLISDARPKPSVPPHSHRWTGLVLERTSGSAEDSRGDYFDWPTSVIQSCECGEVRRVEVVP